MNQEVIEYRLKLNKAMTVLASAIITAMVGLAIWAITYPFDGVAGVLGLGVTYFCVAVTTYLYLIAAAIYTDGRARAIIKRFKDLRDPPLHKWRDELEAKDAFETTEYKL